MWLVDEVGLPVDVVAWLGVLVFPVAVVAKGGWIVYPCEVLALVSGFLVTRQVAAMYHLQ